MKRFEHIVIASDLDGTLLALDEAGDARNLERIRYFVENGGHFTIASGRTAYQIRGRIPYPLTLCNLPAVTGNGACLHDFLTDRAVEEYPMPHELVVRLCDYIKAHFPTVGMRASAAIGILAENADNSYIAGDYKNLTSAFRVLPASEWAKGTVYKIAARGDSTDIMAVWQAVSREFADELEVAPSGSNTLDMQKKGRTKAAMLYDMVASYLPYPTVLCTVGDYENDVEMHKLADLPCCPENATDHVKSICRVHLCHHSEGVIGDLIDYLDTHDVSAFATQKEIKHA